MAKPGLIEAAHRGTMFLDEIGDTDLAIQPKLLKVVEEKRFRRLGDVGERRVDVRFVAATNKSLAQLVDEGKFREDLVLPDQHLRAQAAAAAPSQGRYRASGVAAAAAAVPRDRAVRSTQLDPDAEQALVEHTWPGNVRELRNVLERAMLVCSSAVIRRADLRLGPSGGRPAPVQATMSGTLEEVEWAAHPARARGRRGQRSAGRRGASAFRAARSISGSRFRTLAGHRPTPERAARRRVSCGIASSVATCIAAPRATASPGIPNTTHDSRSCAIVTAPA